MGDRVSADQRALAEAAHIAEADAPHLDLTGDVLRQHLGDAHYKDRALLADAKDATMQKSHVAGHNAAESAAVEFASELVPLTEVIGKDGIVPIKLIAPGWGSSGYYSREMLERDGAKVFTKGTQMFMDHPTTAEERERPERSVKDLAAVLTGDAKFQEHPKFGPGLYAPAKVAGNWRPVLEELAPHIGVSIRAMGKQSKADVTREGKTGREIEALVAARSVDFVTQAGAGGRIAQLFESARAGAVITNDDIKNTEEAKRVADQKEIDEAKARADKAEAELTKLKEENTRLSAGTILREAKDFVTAAVAKAELPDFMRERIVTELAKEPRVKDGKLDEAAYKTAIDERVKADRDVVAKITGAGQVRGMGTSAQGGRDYTKELGEAFREMGFDEKESTSLAAGRGN